VYFKQTVNHEFHLIKLGIQCFWLHACLVFGLLLLIWFQITATIQKFISIIFQSFVFVPFSDVSPSCLDALQFAVLQALSNCKMM